MVFSLNTVVVGLLLNLFGFFIAVSNAYRVSGDTWKRRLFRLFSGVALTLALSALNFEPFSVGIAVTALWGLDFRRVVAPNSENGVKNNGVSH